MARIAILTPNFYVKTKEFDGEDRIIFGGGERYLVELCRFLQTEGHHVEVFQPIKPEFAAKVRNSEKSPWERKTIPTWNIIKEYGGLPDVPIHCMPLKESWDYGVSPQLNYTFNEAATSFDLRIYFVTSLCFPEVRHPAISVSHGIFWDMPQAVPRTGSQEQKVEFFRCNLHGFVAPEACVAVDTNVRGVIAAIEPGMENKIHVIPNFVDTSIFKPRTEPKTWTRPRVLYPRRLTTVRGANEFLWLAAQCPDIDFIMCGNSADEKEEQSVQKFAEEGKEGKGGKGSNLTAIWRPMEQMAEIYHEADIAIVPTKAAEGTSLSLLESMASSLPVIASNAGGLPNLLIDGWNGRQIDMNHDSLVKAVKEILASPEDMKRFGERGRQMAVECFDIEIWKRKWKVVLDKVLR